MRIGFAALLALVVPELCLAQSTQPLPVHMLVPGFTVRELPIKVTNLDNVAYGPDGKLYAVGYDGRVHVLTDTDTDGLEDHVEPWCYDHAADLRAPVGVLIRPEGMYVVSKGRVSLLRDTTGSGKADHYEVVVGGWQEIKNNVDALGVAIDKAGNLYYGRGAEDYRNPLLVDKQGVPHYDLKAESGTVMRVSPDRKTREVIATGIRFTVGMAFNREGDLFATDQEGATWVPNGNPLDKLEQLIPGRHYGFPPKSLNPEYLKSIVDEPAVVSFGPQHQSSCGLRFNERTDTQASFGPDAWEGDALVVGESRGKLWRCPLVKTAAGYVGKPILIGTLDMLAIDLAISPKGDLVICCHSGKPDWGTGPKGIGRVFKISYTGRDEPQPVIAWPASREEIRVAFDKPLDPFVLTTSKAVIGGRYVRAADRLEIMKPPYAAVKQQEATPRKTIHVLGQELADGGQTLVLKTEPLPWRANYSVAIPGVKAVGEAGAGSTVDVDVTLNGAVVTSGAGGEGPSRWAPHLDPSVGARWSRGARTEPAGGPETLHTLLDVTAGKVYLTFKADTDLRVKLGSAESTSAGSPDHPAICQLESSVNGPLPLDVHASAPPSGNVSFSASYHTDTDPFERPIPAERLWLPWAKDLPPAPDAPVEHKPLGDWARGKALFYGEAQCYTCHTVRGEGGAVGPDLSNLTFKDPDATLNDILHPSATINPDYVSYAVKTKSGETLTGLVAAEGTDQFRVTEGPGKSTVIRREQVQSMTPSATSLMPEIFQALGPEKLNDVLEFLTGEQPKAAK